MTRQARRSGRLVAATLLVAGAALAATGCGDDDGDATASATKRDGKVEIRQVTQPEPDDALTKDLGKLGTTLTKAGCTFGTYEAAEGEHIDESEALRGKDFPPTTGTHYENWAPFGAYDEPVEDGFAVHNLEHGGVVVWLGTKTDDALAGAVEQLLDDEEKWVVAPRRDIEGLFSAAWAKGLSCPPAALEQLGPELTAEALDEWYETVVSTGSEAEKDVPAYAGAMKEPSPTRDISAESPF